MSNQVEVYLESPSQLLTGSGPVLQAAILDFFAAHIRNPNTRKAYARAASDFVLWAERHSIRSLDDVRAIHVAGWVEDMMERYATATVKQHLAGVSMLFDWLVVHQLLTSNPATSVRGPRQRLAKGKTPALDPEEARTLISSIDVSAVIGLRDRALIGTMLYSFARVGAALAMNVEDVFTQRRRLWLRLHEKGGKLHDMPCHHELEEWLVAYVEAALNPSVGSVPLYQSVDRSSGALSGKRLLHANAWAMVKRRARNAGISTEICNHSFRATGITAYLSNDGRLETAAKMANHSSTRTTQLYDRRDDTVVQSEVERIRF